MDWLTSLTWTLRLKSGTLTPKHQLSDMLTKGNFTRDELEQSSSFLQHHPFQLSLFCAKNSCLISCTKTMAKRMQEQKEEERIVGKSRPTARNLSSTVPASSSSAKQSDCVENPGDTQSFRSTDCILRETWRTIKSKFQSRRIVEFSRMAKGCSTEHKHRGTCRNLQHMDTKDIQKTLETPHKLCSETLPPAHTMR